VFSAPAHLQGSHLQSWRQAVRPRYVREWASAQAARGYLSYDGDGRFSLPAEHAIPLTGDHVGGVDGSEGDLEGTDHAGRAGLICLPRLIRSRPSSASTPTRARSTPRASGLPRQACPTAVRFEVASATTFDGSYDLICFFDCLHDMGDPAGACAHVRDQLALGGTLMLIEPYANDGLSDNLNPVGAAYYGFSTLLCTPSSLSQEVGTALGAQAGEARLRETVTRAEFTTLRRVAETPFNILLEATTS
jgi:hypothetical protein